MNHADRIELPYGCTNRDQRYTMADPEHPESDAVGKLRDLRAALRARREAPHG